MYSGEETKTPSTSKKFKNDNLESIRSAADGIVWNGKLLGKLRPFSPLIRIRGFLLEDYRSFMKKTWRTFPSTSITADTHGALQNGASPLCNPNCTRMPDDSPQLFRALRYKSVFPPQVVSQ